MALAMANSLVISNFKFDPVNIRYMFHLWLKHGLSNGGRPRSIGLGGNIAISMSEFIDDQESYTDPGDGFNSGNGSLMRLAPIPIAFRNKPEEAADLSASSSYTTHNGVEAA